MDIAIHAAFLPNEALDESLAFYRDALGFMVGNDIEADGMRGPICPSSCNRRPGTPASPSRSV